MQFVDAIRAELVGKNMVPPWIYVKGSNPWTGWNNQGDRPCYMEAWQAFRMSLPAGEFVDYLKRWSAPPNWIEGLAKPACVWHLPKDHQQ